MIVRKKESKKKIENIIEVTGEIRQFKSNNGITEEKPNERRKVHDKPNAIRLSVYLKKKKLSTERLCEFNEQNAVIHNLN